MERSGPDRNGGGRWHGSAGAVVRIDSDGARDLVEAYRRAGREVQRAGLAIDRLTRQASDLLRAPVRPAGLTMLASDLELDADDLEWRVDYLEATDGFGAAARGLRSTAPLVGWPSQEPSQVPFDQIAVLLTHVENHDELLMVLQWMLQNGVETDNPFVRNNTLHTQPRIPEQFRPLIAGALATAYNGGWRGPSGQLPVWLTAGMAQYGDLSTESLVALANDAFDETDELTDSATPNPFDLERQPGFFGPFARALVDDPEGGRIFIESLLDEFDETGDTRLNMHEDGSQRAAQLADIVVSAGTTGELDAREAFVDRLIRTINADDDTNGPVFWATWSVHGDLLLEHGRVTSEPTFGQHHLMPDAIRPTWEHHWHEHVSPFVLTSTFEFVQQKKAEANLVLDGMIPGRRIYGWLRDVLDPAPAAPFNDPGGTYEARAKADFIGLDANEPAADRGRHVITHALRDSAPGGDIGQDEFALIDHGPGPDGRATFTVNLPGVIDLSNPVPGWDPTHMSVRDMDMAALLSATSARVEDNLYAQMVIRALQVRETPIGSNLLLVGHSFGADTVADLAAHEEFAYRYNVTHVVAAAYDSVPQLAHISPEIDVLVLQNERDLAIALESSQRFASMSDESVSANTFAHEVQRFDGGMGFDIGHHQDRYIDYLERTDDAELTRFYESLAATGYGDSGTSVAIDVTLDESLLQ